MPCMAGRSAAARYRGPVVARSRSAANLHDRGTACPAATHDRTFAALGDGHQMLMALVWLERHAADA